MEKYSQYSKGQDFQASPSLQRRSLRLDNWWYDDEKEPEENEIEVGRLDLSKNPRIKVDKNDIVVGRLPRHNRPDIWVTPEFEGPITMSKKSTTHEHQSWRVRRVWNFPQFDRHETEHRVTNDELMDHVKSLLGVFDNHRQADKDLQPYQDEIDGNMPPYPKTVGKLNIKLCSPIVDQLPTGEYELRKFGSGIGDGSEYKPEPRRRSEPDKTMGDSESTSTKSSRKQTTKEGVIDSPTTSHSMNNIDNALNQTDKSEINGEEEEKAVPHSSEVGRLQIIEPQAHKPPLPTGDYKWKNAGNTEEAVAVRKSRGTRAHTRVEDGGRNELTPNRANLPEISSVESCENDQLDDNAGVSQQDDQPVDGSDSADAINGRQRREVGRLKVSEHQPFESLPTGDYQWKVRDDGQSDGSISERELNHRMDKKSDPVQQQPQYREATKSGISKVSDIQQQEKQQCEQREVGKLEARPPQGRESQHELKDVCRLDIHEHAANVRTLPTGANKFNHQDMFTERGPDQKARSWSTGSTIPNDSNEEAGSRQREGFDSEDTHAVVHSNIDHDRKPFTDEQQETLPEKRMVGRLEIIEQQPIIPSLPTGEFEWKSQSDKDFEHDGDIRARNQTSSETDSKFSENEKQDSTDGEWGFQVINDVGGQVDGQVSDLEWSNESGILDKLQAVIKIEATRRPVNVEEQTTECERTGGSTDTAKEDTEQVGDVEELGQVGAALESKRPSDSSNGTRIEEGDIRVTSGNEEFLHPTTESDHVRVTRKSDDSVRVTGDDGQHQEPPDKLLDDRVSARDEYRVGGDGKDSLDVEEVESPPDRVKLGIFGTSQDGNSEEHTDQDGRNRGHPSEWDKLPDESKDKKKLGNLGDWKYDDASGGHSEIDGRKGQPSQWDKIPDEGRDKKKLGNLGDWKYDEASGDHSEVDGRNGQPSQWDKISDEGRDKKKLGNLGDWKYDDASGEHSDVDGRKGRPSQWNKIPGDEGKRRQHGELGDWQYEEREGKVLESDGHSSQGRPSRWDEIPDDGGKSKQRATLGDWEYDDGRRRYSEEPGSSKQGRPSQWDTMENETMDKRKPRAQLGDWDYEKRERRYTEGEGAVTRKLGRPSQWDTFEDEKQTRQKRLNPMLGNWKDGYIDDNQDPACTAATNRSEGGPSQWESVDGQEEEERIKRDSALLGDWRHGRQNSSEDEIDADGTTNTALQRRTTSEVSATDDSTDSKKERADLKGQGVAIVKHGDKHKPESSKTTISGNVHDLTSPKGEKRTKRRSKARPRLSESWMSPICFEPAKKGGKGTKKKKGAAKNIAPLPLASSETN